MGKSDDSDLESGYLWEDPGVAAQLPSTDLEWLRVLQQRIVEEEDKGSGLPDGFLQRLNGRLDKVQAPPSLRRRPWVRPVALAACLALICLPMLWPHPQSSELGLDMLNHHQVCNNIPDTPGRRQHFQLWADAHPGMRIPIPLENSAGLHELERRNCNVGEGCRGPHLIFKSADGQLVSLYALPRQEMHSDPRLAAKPRASRVGEYAVVAWQQGDWVFGVVASKPADQVLDWINPALSARTLLEVARALHLQPV